MSASCASLKLNGPTTAAISGTRPLMASRMSAGLLAPSSAPATGGSEWQKMQMDL